MEISSHDKSHGAWKSKNPMDNVDKSLNRRVTTTEIKEIVGSIPALRELLTEALQESAIFFQESTDSLMYSSRFNNKGIEKKLKTEHFKEKVVLQSDSGDESDLEHFETESTSSAKEAMPSGSSSLNLDKKRRFAMSLATLASRPHKRAVIIEEGAISVIISLSSNPDEFIQRCCSCAFSFLATEKSGRLHLLEEGAMGSIVSLATSSSTFNQVVKNNCCRTLCNMCVEVGHEYKAIRDGILTAVMHVVATCPDMVDICLQILLNITSVQEKYGRIEEVTDLLLQLTPYLVTDSHEISFLTILLNLSSLRNNQLRLVEDGCLKIVERELKSPILQLRSIAANIFGNLTTDSRSKNKLIEGNAIQTMLDMMRDEDEGIRIVAVKAFYNLAKDPQFRQKILHSDAVSVMIVMSRLHFVDMRFGRNVMKVLRLLCGEAIVVGKLIEEGVVLGLKHLLSKNDVIIRQYVVASTCCLFQAEGALGTLIKEGAIDLLIVLSADVSDLIVTEWCCYGLYTLSIHGSCPVEILQHDILPCLLRLCEVQSERIRYFCAGALACISQIADLDSSSAIATAVTMMSSEQNPITQRNCAVILYNLANDDDNCTSMLDAGALMHVVHLTQADLSATKIKCAAILSRLSLHAKHYDQFARHGVLRVLLNLCNVDNILTQRKLVIAISNLSQNDDLRDELLLLKPVPFIISMAAKRDENLRRGCASIFCNLSFKEGSEESLVSAGIVPSLLVTAMITSDQMQAKVICVKALVNLMADKNTFQLMAREGVIWGLSSLALLDHFELSQMCAQALCSFSYEYSRDMLASPSSVKAVLQFIGLDETELQRAGARTLTNMLMQTADHDVEFRRLAVEHMSFLATNTDPEICELCVICLCFSSQSEICRELIVKSHMLTVIGGGTVFLDRELSFAYLSMLGNVANDASVRSMILNDRPDLVMERFMKIAVMNDRILDLSIARAVYTISCAPENLSKMAGHNILTLIKLLWDAQAAVEEECPESLHPQDLHKLLIATMYNLSTHLESQNLLVTGGYIELVMSMWEVAKKERDTCSLACYSVYHMACGTTSSSRLVNCGCAPVLCFVWAAHAQNIPEFKEYSFPLDMQLRCAMAMRNMMCVVANQQELVAAGCVDALVSIAQWAESKSAAYQLKGGVPRKYSVSPVPNKNMRGENDIRTLEETRKHCAAALRCLTFNKGLRDGLSSRGAVTVLLDDLNASMKEEAFPIEYDLLCQLEAESWQNGSRSKGAKEGRAPPIGTAPIHTTLLSITQKIAIEFTVRSAVLQKYRVKVQLEEPLMEQGAAFDPLLEDISTLTAFVNPDSNRSTVMSQSEKKEWPALDLTLALASPEGVEIAAPHRARSSTAEGTSMNSCREDRKQSLEMQNMPHTPSLDDWRDRVRDRDPPSSSGERKPSIPRGHTLIQNGSSSSRRSLHYSLPEVKYSRSLTIDMDYRTQNRLNSSHSQLDMSLPSDLPPLLSTIPSGRLAKKGKLRVAPRSEEKFNNLVSFINHTRKTKGDIGDVLNKWSKFGTSK